MTTEELYIGNNSNTLPFLLDSGASNHLINREDWGKRLQLVEEADKYFSGE